MKKKHMLLLVVCMLLCLFAGDTALAVEDRVKTAVTTAIQELKKDLHPEYSKKTYSYPKKRGYNKLNSAQKKVYREMYKKITAFEDFSYSAEKYGYDFLNSLLVVWEGIREDYPEIDNYFTLIDINNDEGIVTSLDSRYYASWDQDRNVSLSTVKKKQKEFEQTADYIVKKMPKNLSTYDKYRYLAYVISELSDYNYGELKVSDAAPYGPLMVGDSICQGYSLVMNYLCKKADLYCVMASGSSRGTAHAWNLVKLSTGTYHIDITWSDESGSIGSPQWMTYFMLTQSAIQTDHEVDSGSKATGKLNYNAPLSLYTNIPAKGERYRDEARGAVYRVISSNLESLQVEYYRPLNKKKTKQVIPRTVTINGNIFRVTRIASKAFQGNSKLKNVVIQTPYLTKVGANAFKGIHKNAQISVPKAKLSTYRSLLKNKGQKSTVKIVKA